MQLQRGHDPQVEDPCFSMFQFYSCSPISVQIFLFSFQLDISTHMLIRHLKTNTSQIELWNFLTKSAPPEVFLFSVNAVHSANCSTSQSFFTPLWFHTLLGSYSSPKHCDSEVRLELRNPFPPEPRHRKLTGPPDSMLWELSLTNICRVVFFLHPVSLHPAVAPAPCDLPQPSFPTYCKVLPVLGNSTKTAWFSLTTPSRFPLSGHSLVHCLHSPLPHWGCFVFFHRSSFLKLSVGNLHFLRVLVSHFFKNRPYITVSTVYFVFSFRS